MSEVQVDGSAEDAAATRHPPVGRFPVAQLRQPGQALGPRANRTIARIVDATRQIFPRRGYAGTTIDEITNLAGISRASFYTYFPSKRDVLLTLGADAAGAAGDLVRALSRIGRSWQPADLEAWVAAYFAFLDENGSFTFAWVEAAHEDDDIRVAGMKRHLQLCRHLGEVLGALGDTAPTDPTELGLVVFSMLERAWSYGQLYSRRMSGPAIHRNAAAVLASLIRCPPDGSPD
jgi:AcrR family transcriptional regulator